MTAVLSGRELSGQLSARFPSAVVEVTADSLLIKSESLTDVAAFLKNDPALSCDLLVDITSVDYWDYFELVYRFTSLKNNHTVILKTRCAGRENPQVPSLTPLWKGAGIMEREVFDLMGIGFTGHPDLRRIFLWEGFQGYPLRKDYL